MTSDNQIPVKPMASTARRADLRNGNLPSLCQLVMALNTQDLSWLVPWGHDLCDVESSAASGLLYITTHRRRVRQPGAVQRLTGSLIRPDAGRRRVDGGGEHSTTGRGR